MIRPASFGAGFFVGELHVLWRVRFTIDVALLPTVAADLFTHLRQRDHAGQTPPSFAVFKLESSFPGVPEERTESGLNDI
jgi:hypothetical protein